MSLEESKPAAEKAADAILKNSGADGVLLIVVKDGQSLLASKSSPVGLPGLVIATHAASDKIMDECVKNPPALMKLLSMQQESE